MIRLRLLIFAMLDLLAAGWLVWQLLHPEIRTPVSLALTVSVVVLAMIAAGLEFFYPAVFGLVIKQMRQRTLGTGLTLLSVLLGVALAVAILLVRRESGHLFGQSDFGYELIVGPPRGADLSLVLSTVYQLGDSKGNVPYKVLKEMTDKNGRYRPLVREAVPIMVGDSYKGRRIVGTSPQMFGYDDDGNLVSAEGHHPWEYRVGKSFEMAAGRAFLPRKFEAVIGSEVAARLNMCTAQDKDKPENKGRVSAFQATHGFPPPGQPPEIHKPVWQIVGVLAPTHTAADRALYVPIVSLYSIEEHSSGLIQQEMLKKGIDPSKVTAAELPAMLKDLGFNPDEVPASVMRKLRSLGAGNAPATAPSALMTQPTNAAATVAPGGDLMHAIPATPAPKPAAATEPAGDDEEKDAFHFDAKGDIIPDIPEDEWALSAILVKTRGPFQASTLEYDFRVANPDAMAVSPAVTMREFFDTFLKGSTLLLLAIAAVVSVVAAVSILVSIYNSVSARQKEIAILRALGATRGKVLGLICLEAGLIGLFGGLLGLVVGHLVGAGGSVFFQETLGEGINWASVSVEELYYLAAVVVVAVVAGLVPALKAYRTPVATNLVAS